MGRTLDQVIADLTPARRARVEKQYRRLKQEVEGLRELRSLADLDATWVKVVQRLPVKVTPEANQPDPREPHAN